MSTVTADESVPWPLVFEEPFYSEVLLLCVGDVLLLLFDFESRSADWWLSSLPALSFWAVDSADCESFALAEDTALSSSSILCFKFIAFCFIMSM